MYRFNQSILNYADDRYFKLALEASYEPTVLSPSALPLLVTDPAHDFVFKTAILNSVVGGRYVIVAEPSDVVRICAQHGNRIELVATREIEALPKEVKVLVAKGSGVLKNHTNRQEF